MRYGYVLLSAALSVCAVLCRQTNIVLAVLNPALILLLRVGDCMGVNRSMDWFVVARNLKEWGLKSFTFSRCLCLSCISFSGWPFLILLCSSHSFYFSLEMGIQSCWEIVRITRFRSILCRYATFLSSFVRCSLMTLCSNVIRQCEILQLSSRDGI